MTDLPPIARSDAALVPVVAALEGVLLLQRCSDCAAVLYPPADLCSRCLGEQLAWDRVESGAMVLATTQIHRSVEPWFQAQAPWVIGLVRIDAGPVAIVHLPGRSGAGNRVTVTYHLDASGRPVLVAGGPKDRTRSAFSAIIDTVCVLATDDPQGAAERVAQALGIASCTDIAVDEGPPFRVSARHEGRLLRLELHPRKDIG